MGLWSRRVPGGVPAWLKKLLNASSDAREEQTDRMASQFFQDIFDESGNVRARARATGALEGERCCYELFVVD